MVYENSAELANAGMTCWNLAEHGNVAIHSFYISLRTEAVGEID
jgi:hypothetical protein